MGISAELKEALSSRRLVRVDRPGFESRFGYGIPILLSKDLVVLRQYDPEWFQFNGYACYRISDIDDVRSNEYDRYHEEILRREGVKDEPQGTNVSPDGLPSLMKSLRDQEEVVIIECEDLPEEEFWLGQISDVSDTDVRVRALDALGAWDSSPTEIRLAEVSSVQWRERYTEVYGKHAAEASSG